MSGNVTGTSSDDCRRLACGVTFCGDPHQARGAGFQRSRWATFVLHCRMPLRGTTDEVWLRGKSGKYKCMMGWQPTEQPSVEHLALVVVTVWLWDDCDRRLVSWGDIIMRSPHQARHQATHEGVIRHPPGFPWQSGKYKCMMGWQPKEQPSVEHWLIRCDCVALDDCDGQACVVG